MAIIQKAFIYAICFTCSLVSCWADDSVISISKYIEKIASLRPKPAEAESCNRGFELLVEPFHINVLSFKRENIGWNSKSFCSPFRVEEFCTAVLNACAINFISYKCSLRFSDEYVDMRYSNLDFRLFILKKTQAYFNTAVADPMLQQLCCGSDLNCITMFGKTKLAILNGENRYSEKGHYQQKNHTVEISEGLLLHQMTEQNMEYIVTHELGHACQWSRHQGVVPNLSLPYLDPMRLFTLEDLEKTLGVETKNCIQRSIDKNYPDGKRGAMLGEVFADTIFRERLTSLSHWSRPCSMLEGDDIHAPPKVFLNCLFNRQPLKGRFCPK